MAKTFISSGDASLKFVSQGDKDLGDMLRLTAADTATGEIGETKKEEGEEEEAKEQGVEEEEETTGNDDDDGKGKNKVKTKKLRMSVIVCIVQGMKLSDCTNTEWCTAAPSR